jgi:carbon-monoxide dehydrogenase large subunit
LLTSTQAWDEDIEAELGLDRDGRILGLRAKVWADVGAYSIYPWTASIEVIQVVSFLPGPYRVPHYRGEAWGVATNKAPMGPYRGVGRPVSTFVMEALLDRAARRLGWIRRRQACQMIRADGSPTARRRVWCGTRGLHGSLEQNGEAVDCASARGASVTRARAVAPASVSPRTSGDRRGLGHSASPGADIATGTEAPPCGSIRPGR